MSEDKHGYTSLTGMRYAKWRCDCGAVETWCPDLEEWISVETIELCNYARWFAHTGVVPYHKGPACGTTYGPISHRKAREPLCDECTEVWGQIVKEARGKSHRARASMD